MTQPAYDTQDLPFIEASVNYVVDNGIKPVTHISPYGESNRRDETPDHRTVPVYDGRSVADELTLDANGFEFHNRPTAVTDNTTISGETIDYGPCAFMDSYAPDTVFSSIDTQGRYAYGNQPDILGWNLARLAETLIPLIDPDKDGAIEILTDVINTTPARYDAHWTAAMRRKIGLTTEQAADGELIGGLLTAMHQGGADFTLVFRHLATALRGNAIPVQGQFAELSAINAWLENWRARLSGEDVEAEARADAMDRINPIYIPRNHKVEEALTAAVEHEDMSPFEALLAAVSHPFDVIAGQESYAEPGAQTTLPYQTFCGT